MQIQTFNSLEQFRDTVLPWLLVEEALNMLLIGVIHDNIRKDRETNCPPQRLLAAVRDDAGGIQAVTFRTRPRLALISPGPAPAIKALARWHAERDRALPGVMGSFEESRVFAATWSNTTGIGSQVHLELIAHQLIKICWPRGVDGRLRLAETTDRQQLAKWAAAFDEEVGATHNPSPGEYEYVDGHLARRTAYVWEDAGRAVSMLTLSGETPNGFRITGVYTPREERRRGYASALVAAASQAVLDRGKARCFLFTDAANPTSNHIYRLVGYEPVGVFREYAFASCK